MPSAVDVDDVSGCEREGAGSDGGDGLGDVLGLSPPADGGQSVGDSPIVVLFGGGGHVGLDESGADFVDVDAFAGKTTCKEFVHHGEGGFGEAVFGPVGADGVRAEGADDDDGGVFDEPIGFEPDHDPGDTLGEKVGALEIGVHDVVVALLVGVEEVVSFEGSDAGVVDEEVDAAEALECVLDEEVSIGAEADVSGTDVSEAAGIFNALSRLLGGGEVFAVVDEDGVVLSGEFNGDATSDASGSAGDEGYFAIGHGVENPLQRTLRRTGR